MTTIENGIEQTYYNLSGRTNAGIRWKDPANGWEVSALVTSPDVAAWLAAGNTPAAAPSPTPQESYSAAVLAGVEITSTGTPALNGTYAIDPASQQAITSEALYIQVTTVQGAAKFTNGQTTKGWPDRSGTPHTFTTAQFITFAEGVAQYVDALATAQAVALAPEGNWTAPPQPVTIP